MNKVKYLLLPKRGQLYFGYRFAVVAIVPLAIRQRSSLSIPETIPDCS